MNVPSFRIAKLLGIPVVLGSTACLPLVLPMYEPAAGAPIDETSSCGWPIVESRIADFCDRTD